MCPGGILGCPGVIKLTCLSVTQVSRNVTVTSSHTATQIDFKLFRKSLHKLVINVKVIHQTSKRVDAKRSSEV